jgi:glycosyltransferase involved in cell wall biosynthesis
MPGIQAGQQRFRLKKQLILVQLFEFGGINTHLKSLIAYFGKNNLLLILEDENQMELFSKLDGFGGVQAIVAPALHPYAHLNYSSTASNIKELFRIGRSIYRMLAILIRYKAGGLTISAAEPEKFLYFLWLPFIQVNYIIHTVPQKKFTSFTAYTCNRRLNLRKHITTVSAHNKELIWTNWEISKPKHQFIQVIYNCVLIHPSSGPMMFDSQMRNILTMGHVIDYKNPQLWLDIAKTITALYDDVQFIWLGSGPLLEAMKAATVTLPQISFPGAVTSPDTYLSKAYIYYQPSLYETQGIGVLEAMSHYLPCVVTRTGGLPESVTDNYNGLLVDPLNAREHIAALIDLLDNPEKCRRLGHTGRMKYESTFSFAHFKTSMDTIYHRSKSSPLVPA